MLAVEWGSGQVLWSILWFFLFLLWIWLIITIFGDIMRSDDLSGGGKALWAILIIFLPFLGIFLYLIVRGGRMSDRAAEDAQAQQAAVDDHIRRSASTGSLGDQLTRLSALHSAGQIDDDEYAAAKTKLLS
jgi:type VI protein secretion system component VasK